MTESAELQKYHPRYRESLAGFTLPPEQAKFTAFPIDCLDAAEGKHPIVILAASEPAGFFVLHSSERVKEYTSMPKSLLLTAFSINSPYQGKGYAKAAMLKLKSFIPIEFPEYREIVLAVNHKNIAAQKLYEKAGFLDTGNRKIGKIGEQYIFRLSI